MDEEVRSELEDRTRPDRSCKVGDWEAIQDDSRLEWTEVEADLMRDPLAMVEHWLAKSAASARMRDMDNKLGTDAAARKKISSDTAYGIALGRRSK